MRTNIFVPKRINVGFQDERDTYTGMLGYIIYWDEKGTLRKEASWKKWKYDHIPNEEYDNEPMSGFVLNKKAGDYSTGWNHRQAKVRVFDPRGFEIEISISNLLYILENTNSIKGKGLEGEFVYGWDDKELILVPAESPDYKEIEELNKLIHQQQKIGAKDLKIGGTYLTKKNEKLVYMGRFKDYGYRRNGKHSFFFYKVNDNGEVIYLERFASVAGKLIAVVSDECAENYADLFDKLEGCSYYSPVDRTKDELVPMVAEDFDKMHYSKDVYIESGNNLYVYKNRDTGEFYREVPNPDYVAGTWENRWKSVGTPKLRIEYKDVHEMIEKLKPMRLRVYLENGKIYSEDY